MEVLARTKARTITLTWLLLHTGASALLTFSRVVLIEGQEPVKINEISGKSRINHGGHFPIPWVPLLGTLATNPCLYHPTNMLCK
jgi:hypothetical protein